MDTGAPLSVPHDRRLVLMSTDTTSPVVQCQHCGCSFTYSHYGAAGRPRKHCSPECRTAWRDSRPETKEAQRAYRERAKGTDKYLARRRVEKAKYRRHRRERIKGESIDPITVFERDRWKCQLCGCRVVRSIGDNRDSEATLDHIVSIASGGAHAWANVQTACRRCNYLKGASNRGQIRLF